MRKLTEMDPLRQADLTALATELHAHGTARTNPIREVPAMLGDRWTSLVLLVLQTGALHHADLRRVLGQLSAEGRISQRVLTLKLRNLERNGFVQRNSTSEVPPRVSYSLTPLGSDLVDEARRLISWVKAHRASIEAARTAFTQRRSKPAP